MNIRKKTRSLWIYAGKITVNPRIEEVKVVLIGKRSIQKSVELLAKKLLEMKLTYY